MKRLRSKGFLVLAGLLIAAALFGSASMLWFQVTVPNPVQEIQVGVRGTEASPAVPALALVAAAACLALSIAGRVLRWVVGAVIPLAATGIVISVVTTLADPVRATETAVGESAGVIGADAGIDQAAWPWATLVLSVLLLVIGIWILVAMRGWSSNTSSRYERERDVSAPSSAAETQPGPAVHDPDAARRDGIDAWDAFSDGQDPTGR
ncbi:Trp biosynthesis-associated membrane protein [Kocuria sp.]|uniref:Trp biosynthesis-associated membrane protein n=1 Tax=Kocuria sp. TaxID=1871328 RepID=UPI0026E0E75E|nr:Trp biosynthesis-associated membrane protein [Kocuria sp.]MDO5617721.1 Trp biosynthesis-associated membrane protein [Kocuria sp.]